MITVISFTMGIILALLIGMGIGYFLANLLISSAINNKISRSTILKQLHSDFSDDFHETCDCYRGYTIIPDLPNENK